MLDATLVTPVIVGVYEPLVSSLFILPVVVSIVNPITFEVVIGTLSLLRNNEVNRPLAPVTPDKLTSPCVAETTPLKVDCFVVVLNLSLIHI